MPSQCKRSYLLTSFTENESIKFLIVGGSGVIVDPAVSMYKKCFPK